MKDLAFKKLQTDSRPGRSGVMSILELKDFIDFEVKRVYFMTQPMSATGQHAHHTEKELFVMQVGSCTAVIDRGNGLEDVRLEGPHDAIYVGNYVWHGFKDFSPDSVLLALSSTNYIPDRSDYIENYEQYREIIAQ